MKVEMSVGTLLKLAKPDVVCCGNPMRVDTEGRQGPYWNIRYRCSHCNKEVVISQPYVKLRQMTKEEVKTDGE